MNSHPNDIALSAPVGAVGLQSADVDKLSYSSAAESQLIQYVSVLQRRLPLILIVLGAALAIGLYSTFSTVPLFRATTIIQIDREAARVVKQGDAETNIAARPGPEFYNTQYGLIASRNVASAVVRKLRLADNSALLAGYSGTDPEDVMRASREARTRRAIGLVMSHTNVDPVRNSGLVNISFASPDRALSAQVANSIASTYIELNLQRRFDANSYARTFLEQELARVRRALEDSEQQVVAYGNNADIVELNQQVSEGGQSSGQTVDELSLAALNSSLAAARAERIAAEARARNRSSLALASDPAMQALRQQQSQLQGEYARLLATFKPDYPAMVALRDQIESVNRSISQQSARLSESINGEYRAALEQETRLAAQVNGLQSDVQNLNSRRIQYRIFQRDADTNRALYQSLLERYKEIGVAGGIGTSNVSVVDPAQTPGGPYTPNLLMNLLISALAGLAIGIAIAFILEQLDGAIKAPSDVEDSLGVPMLGVIPQTEFEGVIAELKDRKSELSEAYLSVQTSLRFSTEHGVPKTLCITSSNETEGKSTTSLAIASNTGRGDKRTLLIDGDMRNSSLHKSLGIERGRGLSDLLSGASVDSVEYHQVGDSNLFAMTAGELPPNPAELLSTTRLAQVLEQLSERFDHVIIDAPPVIGLADAPLISSVTDATVFVVKSGSTGTKSAIASLRRLRDVGVKVLGVVLTHYSNRHANYSYSYSYNYIYRYGPKTERRSLLERLGLK